MSLKRIINNMPFPCLQERPATALGVGLQAGNVETISLCFFSIVIFFFILFFILIQNDQNNKMGEAVEFDVSLSPCSRCMLRHKHPNR